MTWIEALKKWNAGKAKWTMPKKGTPEHAEVMALMEKHKTPKAEEKPKEARKKKEPKELTEEMKEETLVHKLHQKHKRASKKAEMMGQVKE